MTALPTRTDLKASHIDLAGTTDTAERVEVTETNHAAARVEVTETNGTNEAVR